MNQPAAARQSFDAVVVGSGIGGSTHVFRRAGRWEFDVGTHYLGDCGPDGVMPTILRGVGLDKSIEFLPLDSAAFDVIVLPDRIIPVRMGWDRFRAALIEEFPREEKAIRHFIGVLEKLGAAIDHVHAPRSLRETGVFVLKAGLTARWAMRPLSHLLDSVPMSDRLRAALAVHYGTYSSPPTRTPVTVHALMMHTFMTTGAWFSKGGGQTLSARLGEVVVGKGGEIRTRTRVERILVERKRVVGVALADGTRIDAPIVVSNADIKKTYIDLLDSKDVGGATLRRVRGFRMSQPFFNTYLGLDIDLRESRPRRNYFSVPINEDIVSIYKDLAENNNNRTFTEIHDEMMKRLPAFIHLASVKDPGNERLSPPGCSTVQVLTTIPAEPEFWGLTSWPEPGDESYSKDPEYIRIKEHLTDVMIKRLVEAIPEAEGHIVWREAATPFTQHRYTTASDGTPYGIELSVLQFGPFRPGVRTKIKGLFLCGGSNAWGPTVLGAMLSGLHAAGAVLRRDLYADARRGVVLGAPFHDGPTEPTWDPLAAAKAVATRSSGPRRQP